MNRRTFLTLIPAVVLAACGGNVINPLEPDSPTAAPTDTSNPLTPPTPGPTAIPTNTAVPATAKPAAAPPTTVVPPTNNPAPANGKIRSTGNVHMDAHNARLYELEMAYVKRDANGVPSMDSLINWMRGAGIVLSGPIKEARQVEEELIPLSDGTTKHVVSGIQLRVTQLEASWPSAFTTDRPFYLRANGKALKPDLGNPSHIVTNGVVFDTLTVYGDASNWPNLLTDGFGPDRNPFQNQVNPDKIVVDNAQAPAVPTNQSQTNVAQQPQANTPAAQPTAAAPASSSSTTPLTRKQFAEIGNVIKVVQDNGVDAGLVIAFKSDWQKPEWVDQIHLNNQPVQTAPAGKPVTVWLKNEVRPLK